MNRFIKIIGHLLAITAIVILFQIFLKNYDKLSNIQLHGYISYAIIIAVIAIGLTNYWLLAVAWRLQLKHQYPEFTKITAFSIIAVSQIAKYLPGNIGHFAGRFYLANKHLKKADIVYSLLVENILFVVALTLMSSVYLLYADINQWLNHKVYWFLGLLLLMLPFAYLANKKIKINIVSLTHNYIMTGKLVALFVLMVLLGGISVYIIFTLIDHSNTPPFWLLCSAFSLSFMLGFIVPGAPGGIGIREYVFTVLIAPFTGQIIALQVIIILRLLSMVSDIILLIIGIFFQKNTLESRHV